MGTRVFRIAAVTLPVTVVVGLLAQGQGFPVSSHPMDSGGAWFPSLSVGQLTLIDGPSKQVVTEVSVAEPGAIISAVQAGTGAYVTNQSAGTVTRVDGATYTSSDGIALIDGAGAGLQAFAGDQLVYVLDRQRGIVVAADKTLRRSQPPASLAASVTDGVVDGDGRLWALDGASGDLITLDDTGRNVIGGLVDPSRADLELAGDRLAVIDQTARTIHVVEPRSREIVDDVCIDVAADDRSVRVAGSPDARRVHVVSGQRGVLLTSDLDTGDCSSVVQVADPGAVLGVPQEAGGRVFVPDFSTGQVHIVDLGDGEVTADADLFDTATEFELLARNGIVFYNDPHTKRAGVIDLDGTVHPIDKYAADDQGEQPKDTPGRGKDGDTNEDEDDQGDNGNENEEDDDGSDQDNDGQEDSDDGDQPDSDQPGGNQPVPPLEPQPGADDPAPLPDLDLPPANTGGGTAQPPTNDPGGINPPVVDPPAEPPGQDPPVEPPGEEEPPGDDPPVEPPVALKSCDSTTLTTGDQLQCNWANSRPGDPPGTSLGGQPDTWEWQLTGPETATSTGPSFSHPMDTPGTYQLTLTVTNAADSDFGTTEITVSAALEPPDAQFACNNTSLTAGDQLQCNWSGNGGTPDTWNWSLTGPDTGGSTSTSFARTMSQPGTYGLSLTVTNTADSNTATTTINVSAAPEPPQVNLLCLPSPPVRVGGTVECGASTSGGVDRTLWTWDPPGAGGYSGREQSGLTETFAEPGTHNVTVTVEGPGGPPDSDSWSINVPAPLPPPPSITSLNCHSAGGLGNQDPPVWFGGQVLTCSVNVNGEVDSIDWSMDPGGVHRTGQSVQFGLRGQPPGGREPHRVDVTASGPGGDDSDSLDFIVRACDNHPDPPCHRF